MFDLFDLVIVMVLVGIGALFWQLRRISEVAQFHAQRACRQRRLQLLNVARSKARLGWIPGGGIGWHCEYQCEFSTDGMNQLTATLEMMGNRLKAVQMPFYPEPEWDQAPMARGKVGMGGCGGGSCAPKSGCNTGCR
ncbi:DUF3301 domain-containing protein [Ferrimonas balearica]|uniref:DUF3301 domain-containing protein n=1 Tax=Ferrimonas balearica TaxID=44012 RepID=UPI001C99C96D|nr:DUF3301 domain-containing protein [Ferrimonas balearica]MBY5990646.1 DUF3301 domain-containing protein [Ferrimonas balearica]